MLGQIVAFSVAATLVTISPGPDMALIARRAITDGWRRASVAIHIAIGVVWLLTWAWLVSRPSGAISSRWRATLERVTGTVLIALGLRLATTSR